MSRTVAWFSAGAASAVATKLTLASDPDTEVVYVDTGSEHPDNPRFIADCEAWFDHPVQVRRSDKYRDTWHVWESKRFLVSEHGAPCTLALKKQVRFEFEDPADVQVFGYTADKRDSERADRFRIQNPDVTLVTPLIERELTKTDCLAIIDRVGIELPVMYRLGFRNNNCIGCVKGGMGYWNHIRRHFPTTFDRMALLEREIGHSLLSDPAGPVWLDELDPDRGDLLEEPDMDCSLLCAITESELAGLIGHEISEWADEETRGLSTGDNWMKPKIDRALGVEK